MNVLPLMESRFWDMAGWTMVHFFWVGVIIWALAVGMRLLTGSARPNIRYACALLCLTLFAVAPAVLAVQVLKPPLLGEGDFDSYGAEPNPAHQDVVPIARESETDSAVEQRPVPQVPEIRISRLAQVIGVLARWLPWAWLGGTPVVFTVVAMGLLGGERLRRQSRIAADTELSRLCQRLAQRLKIAGEVAVAVCDRVGTPILVGIVRPVILIPPSVLSGCSPGQIEMILLHELTHVRRWDNLVNLLQRVVESALFFHPGVWWVSHWVRLERECCCDAVVVNHTGRAYAYAETLASLSLPGLIVPNSVAAMSNSHLVTRIRRILDLEGPNMKVSRTLFAVVGALLATPLLTLIVLSTHSEADELASDTPSAVRPTNAENDMLLFASKRTGDFEIYLMNADGTGAKNLSNNASEDGAPDWSPNGTKIVFASDRGDSRNIYIMDADGTNVSQLTDDARSDYGPAWSPDGKMITFRRTMAERLTGDVFVIDADGSNERNLTKHDAHDGDGTWSPDGKTIAFSSTRGGQGFGLYIMNADGSNVRRLVDRYTGYTFPSWSADGSKIAYTGMSAPPVWYQVFVCDADGTNERQLTSQEGGMNTYAVWSPDGNKLAFQFRAQGRETTDLYIMDADGSNQKQVLTGETFLGHGGGQPAWGRRD